VTWQEGDLDGALRAYASALQNFQEIGDKLNIAAAKDNLGSVHYLKGDLKISEGLFQEALAGFREVGSKTSVANALENLAAPVSGQGNLEAARKMLEEAVAIDRKQGVKSETAWGIAGLGDIDLAENKLDDAARNYNEALAVRKEIGEKGTIAESQLALAILSLERGRPSEAEITLRQAREEFRNEKQTDNEMLADTVLARALMAQGKYPEAQKEIIAGKTFLAKSQNRANHLQLGLAEAQLQAAQNRREEANRTLAAILAAAKQTGLLQYQFEARLELSKNEMKSGKTVAGNAHLVALQKDAESKGFRLIARKAEELTGRSS
jgi:tetratricopeptide (TPR) repeat protein